MLSRRTLLAGSAASLIFSPRRSALARAVLTDDGLYTQPWFVTSLLELADDLAAAAEQKKRFAIMWELRGCPYCRQTHLVSFAVPEIETYIRERFDILQLNIIGAREVTDFDGERVPEKRLAAKYGVRGTPTFQFFPDSAEGLAGRTPRERELLRSQGYLEPKPFMAMFRFVAEKAYERGTLQDYLRTNS